MVVLSSLRASSGVLRATTGTRCSPFLRIGWRRLSVSRTNSVADDLVLPVLIVGAGPVGLILSMLLTKLGVDCAILEKSKTFSNHPQAHFINNRSMEIFRKLDGLAEEIQRLEPAVDLWRKFVYCTSLTGSVLGTVDHMQPQDFEKVVSPVSVAHFSQYKLTRLLVDRVKNLNFQFHNPEGLGSILPTKGRDILMGHEFVSMDTSPDRCLNVTTSFMEGGEYRERNICCRILVGADGAGSTVRKHAGISLTGEKDLQKLVSVHFLSKGLGQYLLNHRPGMLYFVFNTEAIGVLVAHDLEQGEFVLQIPFYPPQQDIKDFTPKICEEVILKLVGREIGDIDVIGIKPWVMHAEVAEKYVCFDNRVVLAGDAAHRFPPAGGFGMNTGIQDAHNLAWKLASILKGISPPSYLQTYEAERRPIALFNTALSVQNFRAAMAVPSALGLDPQIANSVHRVVNDGIGSFLPSGAQKLVLNGIFAIGRSQLSGVLLNENNPLGSSRLETLKQIFHEGKSLQLQFPAEDLGLRYHEGAIIHDTDGASIDPEAPTGRRRDYIPSSDPGGRLPHINVRRILSDNSLEGTISTLDLITGDKIEFLLIIAPIDSSYTLARAALKAAEELNVSAKVCVMWPRGSYANTSEAKTNEGLAPWQNYVDVEETGSPNSLSWWSICRMDETGAVLVRPDEHIAWRTRNGILGDPVTWSSHEQFSFDLTAKTDRDTIFQQN